MGQKVNPHGLRVGVIKDWDSKWYAEKDFADYLVEDNKIRTFLKKKLYSAGVSKIEIERASDRVKIIIFTAKPGVVIGKGGAEIEKVKNAYEILKENYPNTILEASGQEVGLPKGQMGTSEVGHMNLGSGRVAMQPLEAITSAIEDGTILENEKILDVINHVKENNSNLHFFGLLSDGGVHSHINHLKALLELCNKRNFDRVYVHAFTDGRDTDPKSGINFIKGLEDACLND